MTRNTSGNLLVALNETNELLMLQIEVQLASLDSYEAFVLLNAKLEHIKERRRKEEEADAAFLARLTNGT